MPGCHLQPVSGNVRCGHPAGSGRQGTSAGGIGGGASVRAEAFLVLNNGNVRLITMDGGSSAFDRLIDLIPDAVETVSGFMAKRKKNKIKADGDIADDYNEG